MDQEAVNFNTIVKRANNYNNTSLESFHSEIQWNEKMDFVAVGNKSGSIDLFDCTFRHVCVVHGHTRAIYSLCWHPVTMSDGSDSGLRHILASSSQADLPIRIIDLHDVINDVTTAALASVDESGESDTVSLSQTAASPQVISHKFTELVGHTRKVYRLDWSRHRCMLLLSTSSDGSVQIWDVRKSEGVANYRIRFLSDVAVLCGKFSRTNPNVVFSAGNDFALHRWSIDNQTNSIPPTKITPAHSGLNLVVEGSSVTKELPSTATAAEDGNGDATTNEDSAADSTLSQEKRTTEAGISSSSERHPTSTALPLNRRDSTFASCELSTPAANSSQHGGGYVSNKSNKMRCKKPKAMLRHCASITPSKEDAVAECRHLFEKLHADRIHHVTCGTTDSGGGISFSGTAFPHLGLFAGREGAFSTLDDEINRCDSDVSLVEMKSDLLLLKGDVESAVEVATVNNMLSMKHVAASSVCGFHVWYKCVNSILSQSIAAGEINDAVQYMLMLNKTEDAVNLLLTYNRFKEAIAIASTRLPIEHFLRKQVYSKYATLQENSGFFEVACECYLAINDYESAARVLTQRSSVENYMLALDIMLKNLEFAATSSHDDAGFLQKATHYAQMAVFQCFLACDHANALSTTEKHASFSFMRFVVVAFQCVYNELSKKGVDISIANDDFVRHHGDDADADKCDALESAFVSGVVERCIEHVRSDIQLHIPEESQMDDIEMLRERISKMSASIPNIKARLTNIKWCIMASCECCLLALQSWLQPDSARSAECVDIQSRFYQLLSAVKISKPTLPVPPAIVVVENSSVD